MKSISNSDHIYCRIACQKSIPRFLLISVKYLWLSTFPKVADLIGARSLITSHFLWQVCPTGKCISGTLGSSSRPPLLCPFPRSLEEGSSLNRSPALGSVSRKRTTCVVRKTGLASPSSLVSGAVGGPLRPQCSVTPSDPAGRWAPVFLLPLLADFCVDRCALLAAARPSWQEDSSLPSQK